MVRGARGGQSNSLADTELIALSGVRWIQLSPDAAAAKSPGFDEVNRASVTVDYRKRLAVLEG